MEDKMEENLSFYQLTIEFSFASNEYLLTCKGGL